MYKISVEKSQGILDEWNMRMRTELILDPKRDFYEDSNDTWRSIKTGNFLFK
jgi:hypothetical protein